MLVAIDFGITNTDVAINEAEKNKFYTFPTKKINEDFIGNILDTIELNTSKISNIAVSLRLKRIRNMQYFHRVYF